MNLAVKYTNNRGQSIEFGGADEALNLFEGKLRDSEWKYEAGSSYAAPYFYREPDEVTLKVGVAAATEEEGLAWRDRIADIAECDIADGRPGSVEVNGWRLGCYVVAREADNWWMDGRFFECEMTLLVPSRVWRRETVHHFEPSDGGGTGSLDFPFDFPFDFSVSDARSRTIDNGGISAADIVLRFYGPCENPAATVAGNEYGVKVSVPDGAYVEIDTEAMTAELVGKYGDRTNVFPKRIPGGEGSGSYIFEKVPSGIQAVSSRGDVMFDVVLVEHRSEPEWRTR